MIRYKVIIPPADGKRMEADREFLIYYSDGWVTGGACVTKLLEGQSEVEFNLSEPIDMNSGKTDASHYIFEVIYRNSTHSRTETKIVTPIAID